MLEKLKNIGPGAMVAAAFIGPGTVTTATIAGSSYGYTLLWAIVFSVIATYVLQEMAARLGVIGGKGLGEALRLKFETPVLKMVVAALVIGAILIGNAAYEAGNITGAVLGFNPYLKDMSLGFNPLIIVIGIGAFFLLFSGKYKLIERTLVALVALMGIVFLISAIALKPNLGLIVRNIFVPTLPKGSLLMVIGLIGTTVVPYNLFLHASSVKERWSGEKDLSASKIDTLISVVLGGLITMAILLTAAIAFEGMNKTGIGPADLSVQLEPLLGKSASLFIALGFLAAGMSSAVTAPLAAAYATSEILGWEKDMKGSRFRWVWGIVLVAGLLFSMIGFRPTSLILFAQVANGLLLPIIASFLLWVMNDRKLMGERLNSLWVNIIGILVILLTLVLGLRGILSALNVI